MDISENEFGDKGTTFDIIADKQGMAIIAEALTNKKSIKTILLDKNFTPGQSKLREKGSIEKISNLF